MQETKARGKYNLHVKKPRENQVPYLKNNPRLVQCLLTGIRIYFHDKYKTQDKKRRQVDINN